VTTDDQIEEKGYHVRRQSGGRKLDVVLERGGGEGEKNAPSEECDSFGGYPALMTYVLKSRSKRDAHLSLKD